MLAQLLSSKPKTNLINLLLAHPQRAFSFTELRLSSGCSSILLKDTLKELGKMDFLTISVKNKVKYFQMNRHFALYPELVNLLRKVRNVPNDMLAKAGKRISDCKMLALTGVFVGRPRIETDLLFVGKMKPARLKKFIELAEKLAEQEISFTIFTPQEFEYRQIMNDRFVKNILENNPVLVVDKNSQKSKSSNKISKLVYNF